MSICLNGFPLLYTMTSWWDLRPFFRFQSVSTRFQEFRTRAVQLKCMQIYAGLLPILIFVVVYIQRRDVYDLYHAVQGLLFSILITSVFTEAIKNAVGRPHQDFFWQCFPDGKDVYDKWGDVICHGEKNVINEGYKIFPSGHTSCISRVDDYWHHWQDVFAGGLLGLTVATFCYLQFFPPPYHSEGWVPYAYFRMSEESCGMTQVPTVQNSGQEQLPEAQVESQEEQGLHGCMGLTLSRE